jgi:DNA-binding CsgD family transcriptional regulator
MLLGEASNTAGQVNHLEQAIAEAEEHPDLRAAALAAKAMMFTVLLLAQIEAAERWAEEALELVLSAGGQGERRVLAALAWSRALRGRPLVDLQERFQLAHDARASLYEASVDRVIGVQHGFRGELAEAQAMFERLLEIADQRGEALSGEVMRLHLVETAVRRGDCRLIQQTLDEWEQWATLEDLAVSRVRTRALVGAMTGDGAEVRAAADALSEIREPPVWDQLEVARALGITALFERRPTDAAGHLGPVWEHTECEGVADPGAFPVAPDLVQALSELDRGEEAAQIAAMVRARAQAQDHPWATATAARCEAQLALAARWDEAAARALADAAAAYGALGLGFDQGRTLLALGGAQRRYRKWGRARDALRAAVEVFESLGCAGWAEQARSELERVGARRPACDGELTSAEARVVALAAGGLSNKQIAAELVVTIHTVEVHLSRAYAKLGVRSRAQLAQALAALE